MVATPYPARSIWRASAASVVRSRIGSLAAWFEGLSPRREKQLVAAGAILVALGALTLLVAPPRMYVATFSNDVLIFFETADRVLEGQVLNRDVHSPIGPFAMLLPAFGLWLSGGLAHMFPLATAAFTLLLLPVLIYSCTSRLRLLPAFGVTLFVLMLVVAPINVGDAVDASSYAMFYNRFCYAMLSLLLLFALPRRVGSGSLVLDIAALTALLLGMLYTKISYALVGAVLVLALPLVTGSWALGALPIAGSVLGAAFIHLFWPHTGTYIADIAMAGEASGALRGTGWTLSRIVVENATAALLLLSILITGLWRGARLAHLLFACAAALAGLLIYNQNAQWSSVLLFVPAAFVAALAPSAGEPHRAANLDWASIVALLALAVPPTLTSALALGYYSAKSFSTSGSGPFEARLDGMVTREGSLITLRPGIAAYRSIYRSGTADLEALNMVRRIDPRQPIWQTEYIETLHDALALLQRNPALGGATFVFDMANPFNALLDRPPPKGVDAWNHAGRTLSPSVHRPAERMFADVDVILLPKNPMDLDTNQLLREVYGEYVTRHYRKVAETDYWFAYVRRR